MERISIRPATMERISIRPATTEDYEGILAINRTVYRGRDYLPELFYDMMSNENILCLVACNNDQIVGFTSGLVIDGGKTIIRRCGRLHESVQEQGLYKRLMITLRDEIRIRHPKLVSERIVLDDRSAGINRQALMDTEVFRTKICTFRKPPTFGSDKCDEGLESAYVHEVSGEQLEMVLSNKDAVAKFFPKFLTCFWKPFLPDKSNVAQILREKTRLLSSVKIASNNFPELTNLSFYTSYKCAVGIICHIDIYGTDASVTKDHITEISKRMLRKHGCDELFVNVYNYSSLPMETLESFLVGLNFERTKGISEIIILDKGIENMT